MNRTTKVVFFHRFAFVQLSLLIPTFPASHKTPWRVACQTSMGRGLP